MYTLRSTYTHILTHAHICCVRMVYGFSLKWHINLLGLFNAKTIFVEREE